jgi:hypothetical protein
MELLPGRVIRLNGSEQCGFNAETANVGTAEILRKMKYVYYFIMAANNNNFRTCQVNFARNRVDTARNSPVKTKLVKDYITSELGVSLVLDQHISRPGHVGKTVRAAVDDVIVQLTTQNKDEQMLSKITDRTELNACFNSEGEIKPEKADDLRELVQDPGNWGTYEEKLIIKKYIEERQVRSNTTMWDPKGRSDRVVNNASFFGLSDNRDSYNE